MIPLCEAAEDARVQIMRRADVMRRLQRADEQWTAACIDLRDTPAADQSDDQKWNVVAGLFRVADLAREVKDYNRRMRPALESLAADEGPHVF